jgi:hypothetical protein
MSSSASTRRSTCTTRRPAELRGHFKQLVARHDRAKREYHDAAEIIGEGSRAGAKNEVTAQKVADDWDNQWKQPPASTQMLQRKDS